MSDNLTALISRVQVMLLDDGTKFSTATCTAAIRDALRLFNQSAPIQAGTLIDAVASQYEYALNHTDFDGLLDVLNVFWNASGTEGADVIQTYSLYFMDNAPFIRLAYPLPEGTATIDVRFTLGHTIDGLDSEVESTLSTDQDQVLIQAACATACYIRAAGRTEAVNLDADTRQDWKATGDTFMAAFRNAITRYTRRPASAQSADTRAWNDAWHNWQG